MTSSSRLTAFVVVVLTPLVACVVRRDDAAAMCGAVETTADAHADGGATAPAACTARMPVATKLGPAIYADPPQWVLHGSSVYYPAGSAVVRQSVVDPSRAPENVVAVEHPARHVEIANDTLFVSTSEWSGGDANVLSLFARALDGDAAPRSVFTGSADGVGSSFRVAGTNAYFLGTCSNLYAVPLAGGAMAPVATRPCNVFPFRQPPFAITTDAAHAYVEFLQLDNRDTLFEVPLGGGAARPVVKDLRPNELSLDGDDIVYARDGACTYVGSTLERCKDGVIGQWSLRGASGSTLVDLRTIQSPDGYERLGAPVYDANYVYFTIIARGHAGVSVYRVARAGGPAELLYRTSDIGRDTVGQLAVDETYLYFFERTSLSRIPKDGAPFCGWRQGDPKSSIVISQIVPDSSLVELFNPSPAAASVDGLALHYADDSSSFSKDQMVTLPAVTMPPGSYFLVRLGSGVASPSDPTADATGGKYGLKRAGKVALSASWTSLDCGRRYERCGKDRFVDLVGYGDASDFKGTHPAPEVGAGLAAVRKARGCANAGDEAQDFAVAKPWPRNSKTPVAADCAKVQATDLYDDTPSPVVISQVYVSDGTKGSTYDQSFVELFNPSKDLASLEGLALRAATAEGTFEGSVLDLPAIKLAPGAYFLVALGDPSGTGEPLPTADMQGALALPAVNGKVALSWGWVPLACGKISARCASERVADLIGYGRAVDYSGAAPTAPLGNALAAIRRGRGCVETGDNKADFVIDVPLARTRQTSLVLDCANVDADDTGTKRPAAPPAPRPSSTSTSTPPVTAPPSPPAATAKTAATPTTPACGQPTATVDDGCTITRHRTRSSLATVLLALATLGLVVRRRSTPSSIRRP